MGWVRSQLAGLIAVLLLLPAAVVYTLNVDWVGYHDAQPHRVEEIPPGGSAELDGTGFTITDTSIVEGGTSDGDAAGLADDSDLVVVTFRVQPGTYGPEDFFACELQLIATTDAGETRWSQAGPYDTSFRIAEGATGYCDTEQTDAYALQYAFVVPKGVADRAEVEVTVSSELPRALRFRY